MKTIRALIDYKNIFGSKWKSSPYRSGYDKILLEKYFSKYGFKVEYIPFKDVVFNIDQWRDKIFIYTSSEEIGLDYKQYIEDIVLGLECIGAKPIPKFDYLRANNNKTYMEIIRKRLLDQEIPINFSSLYGTIEELKADIDSNKINYPCVIKINSGSMSRGVYLANNSSELMQFARKVSRTRHYLAETKDFLRKLRHQGYIPESKYQNRFIVQPFIHNLSNDWKIIIYGDHYYILNRGIKNKDFRASGSHHNYKAGSKSDFPFQMLDFVEGIYKKFNVPHLSLDFAFDGSKGYIHEFQAVYFGTSTLEFCDVYYTKKNDKWITRNKEFDQEEEYVYGLFNYFESNQPLIES